MGWVILVAYAKQVSAIPIYRTPLTSVKRAYNILKFCQCSEKFQSFNILTFPHSYMLFSMLKRCITEIRKQIDHFLPSKQDSTVLQEVPRYRLHGSCPVFGVGKNHSYCWKFNFNKIIPPKKTCIIMNELFEILFFFNEFFKTKLKVHGKAYNNYIDQII